MAYGIDEIPAEHIPDEASLFMRAHKDFFVEGELQPGVFRFRAKDAYKISVDWAGYEGRTAEHTRQDGRMPSENAVMRLSVGGVRAIKYLEVEHAPEDFNHAHSHIVGDHDACKD